MHKLLVILVLFAFLNAVSLGQQIINGTDIDLEDFDDLEHQSLIYLNRERSEDGIKAAQLNQELMVMAQNEANRLANVSNIETFQFSVERKLIINLYRIIGKNKKGERIGLKKCYNQNDNKTVLIVDQVYRVDDECETVSGKEFNTDLITDFGFGRAFDLSNNKTLYHVRLFYYSDNIEFDLTTIDIANPEFQQFHKYGKKTGLKFLKIE